MAMYELDGNHLLPVRLGRSADAMTLSHSLVAIQRQIVDVLRRPLFPLAWDEVNGGRSLTALDATGQVVVVEVLERVDSVGLLAAMSRLTAAAAAGRRDIAGRYAGGLGTFSKDWNEFREAMPAQVEPGPRLTILSASLEPDVVGGLGVLASSGLEIHEVDVRIVDESRVVVVVEKISGADLNVGGPLLVARAPRPALSGSAGPTGSRAIDASEQAEHMSPVTGPIEIVLPQGAGDTKDGSDGAAVPPGAFAATGAADALSELFEPVAVTTEQPRVNVPAAEEGRTGDRAEDAVGDAASKSDDDASDDLVGDPVTGSVDSDDSADFDGVPVLEPDERSTARGLPEPTESTPTPRATGNTDVAKPGVVAQGSANESAGKAGAGSPGVPETGADDVAGDHADGEESDPDRAVGSVTNVASTSSGHGPSRPVGRSSGRSAKGGAGGADSDRDLADILSGDSLIGPVTVELGDGPDVDDTGRSGPGDGTGVGDSAGGSGGEPSRTGHAGRHDADHSDLAGDADDAGAGVRAAKAWSTVPPHENLPDDPTGMVPPVSWEPLRGSADAPDPVAEALGGDPSKSLVVQETAELAAVAALLGEPTQLIWQRLRRGIYHEAMLSVEGVITLSDGRSFTDPTSAANAAQDVSDADGWRVWRVGARGAHLGDLRDDLADRSS